MKPIEIRLREWSILEPGAPGAEGLAGLRLEEPATRVLAERLRRSRILEIDELASGLRVRTSSHVGRIRLGNIVVTIEPKLGADDLLALFRYAYGLRNLSLFELSPSGAAGRLLPDLLAAQLLAEVSEIVERGLVRRYVERTERLQSPRGRIDFLGLARTGGPVSEIICRHHARSADHLLTRVVKAGIRLAAEIAGDAGLRVSLRRLEGRMADEVDDVALSRSLLIDARRSIDRLVAAYQPALQLIELLYAGHSASLDADDAIAVPGFLFDMNRFFQALVGRWLRDHLDGLEVRDEHALRGMMRYLPGKNPRRRRAPMPRPDFVVLRGRTPVALLDAKYRDLWERSLPRDMLYQLAVYALTRTGSNTAAIVYPTAFTGATESIVAIQEAIGGSTQGYVALRPMVLPRVVALVRDEQRTKDREAIAKALAFGVGATDSFGG